MPSLKDLRNRIAATKATQKITRAMQMVASSKLRRARAAAEAARPYASRMDTVLGNIAASVAGADTAPALLRGTGSDQKHLLLVCTAERGLCGPFNTSIVRLARERAGVLTQPADGTLGVLDAGVRRDVGGDRDHAVDTVERMFHAPETAAGEDRGFAARLRGGALG